MDNGSTWAQAQDTAWTYEFTPSEGDYDILARAYDDTRRYCEAVGAYKRAIEHAYRSDDPGFIIDSARRRVERLSGRYACR